MCVCVGLSCLYLTRAGPSKQHFNTGYLDDFEFAIMDRKRVRDQYLATWFIPDVLSSVPIEIIELVATTGGDGAYLRASKLLKLLRLSRIAKIFRIMKLSKLAKTFQEIRVSGLIWLCLATGIAYIRFVLQDYMEDNLEIHLDNAKLAIGKLFLSLLVLSHWVGCINFMLCRVSPTLPSPSFSAPSTLLFLSQFFHFSFSRIPSSFNLAHVLLTVRSCFTF